MRSSLQDGRQMSLFGRDPVLVNRSRSLERKGAQTTNDTCGLSGSSSSPSAGLQQSLENRLQALLDVNGSLEYVLTWKHWDMPSGPPICALRASARRTSDNGCFGWPTPQACEGPNMSTNRGERHGGRRGRKTPQAADGERGSETMMRGNPTLNGAARLAGWCSPTAMDGNRGNKPARMHDTGVPLSQQVVLAGWPTTKATDGKRGLMTNDGKRGAGIRERITGWATPRSVESGHSTGNPSRAHDKKSRIEDQVYLASGPTSTSSHAPTEKRGGLNPEFPRWLMGFPKIFDRYAPHWKEWDMVQKKCAECLGDRDAFLRWLVEVALQDCAGTEMP